MVFSHYICFKYNTYGNNREPQIHVQWSRADGASDYVLIVPEKLGNRDRMRVQSRRRENKTGW